jgi:hypothetical protein
MAGGGIGRGGSLLGGGASGPAPLGAPGGSRITVRRFSSLFIIDLKCMRATLDGWLSRHFSRTGPHRSADGYGVWFGVNVGDALSGCIIVKVLCCFIIIHSSSSMSELNVNSQYTPIQGISILFSIILCEIIHHSVATQVTKNILFFR